MKRWLLAFLAMFGADVVNADPVTLKRGQVWTFAGAPSETARIIIGDVEPFGQEGDVAVSVSILGLPEQVTANGHHVGGVMYHLPFSEPALRSVLLELVAEDEPLPDGYGEGYAMWKEAVGRGEAGIFTITPADILENVVGKIVGK